MSFSLSSPGPFGTSDGTRAASTLLGRHLAKRERHFEYKAVLLVGLLAFHVEKRQFGEAGKRFLLVDLASVCLVDVVGRLASAHFLDSFEVEFGVGRLDLDRANLDAISVIVFSLSVDASHHVEKRVIGRCMFATPGTGGGLEKTQHVVANRYTPEAQIMLARDDERFDVDRDFSFLIDLSIIK